MAACDIENPRFNYPEPLTVWEQDDKKLAYLLVRIFASSVGDEVKAEFKNAFGSRKLRLHKPTEVSDQLAAIGATPEVLRRMWRAYLNNSDLDPISKPVQRSAWMDCPADLRREREAICKASQELPAQLHEALFGGRWQSEIEGVQECAWLVDALKQQIERLGVARRESRTGEGELIVPLTHGRPLKGASDENKRDLEAYALAVSGLQVRNDEVLSLFLTPEERLGNPQTRKKANGRAHTAKNRVKTWLSTLAEQTRPMRKQVDIPPIHADPKVRQASKAFARLHLVVEESSR
ncbi:MAG: hypothetical protein EON58_04325 [Alphaproteobacteria bacterium]|nr:MAG: hypothetical protein EON58_04325 [Alphaproteobacteria bacterium]